MRIGLFFKYDREVVNGSENREIPDLWGRVDRYDMPRFVWPYSVSMCILTDFLKFSSNFVYIQY